MRDRQVLPEDSQEALAEYKVDLICGGFPCQPFSVAGKRKGTADKRWLWPEFHRIIRLLRPEYILLENVPGILASWGGMGEILRDLAQSGYDAEWDCIPAAAFGAPHLRYRVFIVAYPSQLRCYTWGTEQSLQGIGSSDKAWQDVADTERIYVQGFDNGQGQEQFGRSSWWSTESDVGRVAHGVPSRVDRLKALGNAVVPQVAEWIGRRIMEFESNGR